MHTAVAMPAGHSQFCKKHPESYIVLYKRGQLEFGIGKKIKRSYIFKNVLTQCRYKEKYFPYGINFIRRKEKDKVSFPLFNKSGHRVLTNFNNKPAPQQTSISRLRVFYKTSQNRTVKLLILLNQTLVPVFHMF